jgi:hypothetical protein
LSFPRKRESSFFKNGWTSVGVYPREGGDLGDTFIPNIAFKKSKKTDPFKTFISQLSGSIKLAFHKGCEMEVLNGPNLKNNSIVAMSFMLKTI